MRNVSLPRPDEPGFALAMQTAVVDRLIAHHEGRAPSREYPMPVSLVVSEDGVRGARVSALDTGVGVDAFPAGDLGWELRSWVLPYEPDDVMTGMLALEVVRATDQPHREWTQSPEWGLYGDSRNVDGSSWPMTAEETIFHRAKLLYVALGRATLDQRVHRLTETIADRIPGMHLRHRWGTHPIQADGYWRGYPFYFRLDVIEACLDIRMTEDDTDPHWRAVVDVPAEWRGNMTDRQFVETLLELARRVEKLPPKCSFAQVPESDGYPGRVWTGRGNTLEEAHRAARESVVRVMLSADAAVNIRLEREPLEPFVPRYWPDVDFSVPSFD